MEIYVITMIDGTTKEISSDEMDDFIKENKSQIKGIDKKGK